MTLDGMHRNEVLADGYTNAAPAAHGDAHFRLYFLNLMLGQIALNRSDTQLYCQINANVSVSILRDRPGQRLKKMCGSDERMMNIWSE